MFLMLVYPKLLDLFKMLVGNTEMLNYPQLQGQITP